MALFPGEGTVSCVITGLKSCVLSINLSPSLLTTVISSQKAEPLTIALTAPGGHVFTLMALCELSVRTNAQRPREVMLYPKDSEGP